VGISALVKRIRQAVAGAGTSVDADLRRVEVNLGRTLGERGGPLAEASLALIERGGKRLRPLTAILSGRACKPGCDGAWRVGLVAELVHTATLVHDDLVERSPVRRGASSLHVARGRRTALLTGDYLVAIAFSELAAVDGATGMVRDLGEAIARMADGECLEEAARWRLSLTAGERCAINRSKTAAIFGWCTGAAARAANADAASIAALERFGHLLGEAFQHVDDLLDWVGHEREIGKPVWTDIRHGRITLPVIVGLERDPALTDTLDEIRTDRLEVDALGRRVDEVHQRLAACGAFDEAARRTGALVDEAVRALDALPPSTYRDALARLARTVLEALPVTSQAIPSL
jgi:geranylgeranyl pyrophosphate synthase